MAALLAAKKVNCDKTVDIFVIGTIHRRSFKNS
jgi:hypothetical protein